MEEIKQKLVPKKGQSKIEWIAIIVLRVLSLAYLISIVYLPFVSRFSLDKENVIIPVSDIWWLIGCVVMFGSPGRIIIEMISNAGKKLLGK